MVAMIDDPFRELFAEWLGTDQSALMAVKTMSRSRHPRSVCDRPSPRIGGIPGFSHLAWRLLFAGLTHPSRGGRR